MNIETLYTRYSENYLVDTDTRKIRKGAIYFALKGVNFNGNAFAEEALNKGASYCVVDEEKYANSENILLVDDVLTSLQQLATYHRVQLNIPIIALTGSNGKTTTKELINAVLRKKYKTIATIGNLNNHIGVPLTLLSMTPKTAIGIVEMGANHLKEIEFLCAIANPDYGYITNFGKAHIEGFGSLEGVIEAKSELYVYLKKHRKTAFVNPNDTIQLEKSAGIEQVLFDTQQLLFLEANPLVKISYHTETIQSNLIGDYNFSNLSAAITIGNYFNVLDTDIKEAIENYVSANNRSQVLKTKINTVLLDAYNANPTSMKAALENFNALEASHKTVILGDMFELGKNSAEEHQSMVDLAASLHFTNCYFVGELFSNTHSDQLKFKDLEALSAHLLAHEITDSFILIKGSRGMALERLVELL